MKKITIHILIILFVQFTWVYSQSYFESYNSTSISPNTVIAEIDSISITAAEFFYNYEFGPAFTKRRANSKEIHLDFMINEKLLAMEGLKNNYLNKEDVKSLYLDIYADVATEELYKDSILSKISISDDEINKVSREKQIELEIRWLFDNYDKNIKRMYKELSEGIEFDSLFNDQLNDSVYYDDRSQKVSLYQLRRKNPLLANICDTLTLGTYSEPIESNGEWYIVELSNVIKDLITSESEYIRIRNESVEALKKIKMDSLSDNFVNKLLLANNPIIKRDAFNICRSYIGKYRLKKEKYDNWELEDKLEIALANIGLSTNDNYKEITLVEMAHDNIGLSEFIKWFRNRNLHIKLSKKDINDFSHSLENLVWLMVRDKLLIKVAEENEYYDKSWVKKQGTWWKEKIAYSAFRKNLAESITLNIKEINEDREETKEKLEQEFIKKLFRKLNDLKKAHKINIFYDNLNKINVSLENDKKAIDLYLAKTKGLIPRPPYPTIDNEWANWL